SLIFTFVCSFFFLINYLFIDSILHFFNAISSNIIESSLIYIFTIVIPTIIILVLRKLGYEVPMLTVFSFLNMVFNPITITFIFLTLSLEINIYIIFIPLLITVGSWTFGLIQELIFQFLRL
ncbi:MAG: hypothetical protein HRS50_00785, partial [Mycoplasmataceae bacterium]|nr:hypothetical protein [Mycoplasmataceae bacterium]